MQKEPQVKRKGARGSSAGRDQRTSMLTWAMDKVKSGYPKFDEDVAMTTLCSETRTETALLNSKSAAKTKEIMKAALKRSGPIVAFPE